MDMLEIEPNVFTLAGNTTPGLGNGIGTNTQFYYPFGIALSPDDSFSLITEFTNCLIRKIILTTAEVSTFAGGCGTGNGFGTNAKFLTPIGIDIISDGSYALIVDAPAGLIRKLIISTSEVSTLAGDINGNNILDGFGTNAHFHNPYDISISSDRNFALVSELSRHIIRLVNLTNLQITTLAGNRDSDLIDGIGTNAYFFYPKGLAISPGNDYSLIADSQNQVIRKLVISTAAVTTLPKPTYLVNWSPPEGIDISSGGDFALITQDSYIRTLIISTGMMSTYAGQSYGTVNGIGTNAQFISPKDIMISSTHEFSIVVDHSGHTIRQLNSESPTLYPTFFPMPTTNLPVHNSSNQNEKHLGAIIGVIVGGFVGLFVLAIVTYFFLKRSKATTDSTFLTSKVEMKSSERYDHVAAHDQQTM